MTPSTPGRSEVIRAIDRIPDGMLELETEELHSFLGGPTLIHLPGRRTGALFLSILLHGDEDSGWRGVRDLLLDRGGRELPRALSLFIGNTAAAARRHRYLPGQRDYNRIWTAETDDGGPESAMARNVLLEMRRRNLFASIDIHNNTGLNPHYACVSGLDYSSLHLAALFGRTVVYTLGPKGMQLQAFSPLCPSVTVECGRRGSRRGAEKAREYLDACLHLSSLPDHPVAEHDLDLFHTVATVRVREGTSFSFGGEGTVRFRPDLDRLNFRELPRGEIIGHTDRPLAESLCTLDEEGRDVTGRFFEIEGGKIVTRCALMPSMLTTEAEAVRLDCFCYLMERVDYGRIASVRGDGAV